MTNLHTSLFSPGKSNPSFFSAITAVDDTITAVDDSYTNDELIRLLVAVAQTCASQSPR